MFVVPNLNTYIMKNILRMFLLAALILMASHVAQANNDTDKIKTNKTNVKTSKVYVVLKAGEVSSQFMETYGEKIKNRFAKEGIDADYAILTGKFPNAMYTIALNKGADHIVYINQTRQINIDGKTNVGGLYEVKAFNLSGDYQWKNIENDIRMNVQFDKSINTANDRIIESFLNKI